MTLFVKIAVGIALTLAAASAQGQDLIVEKKTFELPAYTTAGGATIKERQGRLGELRRRSTPTGRTRSSSRTSSRARATPPASTRPTTGRAGYWDPIIGPGKAIDTNKYFVLSSDTLVNLSANRPERRRRPARPRSTRRPASPTA